MQMIKKIKENNTHPGVLLEKNDLSVILLTLLILSILQIWLNLWVCQTGAVLVMFAFGIIMLIKKSFLSATIIIMGSLCIALMAYNNGNETKFTLKKINLENHR